MTLEVQPVSVASDGMMRIAAVPAGANALSVAILNGATAKPVTYSLSGDGWNRTLTENTITDDRLSLKTSFEAAGSQSESLEITYVYGDQNDVLKPLLIPGTVFQFVERRSVPNETAWTVGQTVDVLSGTCGAQRKNPPTKDGVQTITQKIFLNKTTATDQALVA